MKDLRLAVVVFLLAGTAACQISGPEHSDSELQSIEASIVELVGEAPAEQASSCKTIAFGSKPCGGPWSYLIYSSEYTDEDVLVKLVSRYNELQAKINRETGMMSDCAIAIEPDLELRDGFCQAVPEANLVRESN